jgi:hypothetical protein
MTMPGIHDKQKETTFFDARATSDGYDVFTRVDRRAVCGSHAPAEIAASTSSGRSRATISSGLCGRQSSQRSTCSI